MTQSISAIICSMVVLAAPPALAQQGESNVRVAFNIPAQSLESALLELSKQASVQLVISSGSLQERSAPQVSGNLPVNEALDQLLQNTDLGYKWIGERTLTITPKANGLRANAKTVSEASTAPFSRIRLAQSDNAQSDSSRDGSENDPSNSADTNAAPGLEEIVVTAEKREESIQDLPISILSFSGETLETQGITEIDRLPKVVPSLQMQHKNGPFTNISLRGVTARDSTPNAMPLAMSVDSVPYASALLSGLDFFDVERIEVLRGPQGTISGRNSTAGAINVYSKRPTEQFEGLLKATVGSYDRLGLEGNLSGPIIKDRLLVRLAVRSDRDEGWANNTLLAERLGTTDKLQARGSLLAKFSDNFEALLILDGTYDRSKPIFFDDGRVRPDTPSLAEFAGVAPSDTKKHRVSQHISEANNHYKKFQTTLRLSWDLGPSTNLAATTGYVDLFSDETTNIDATAAEALVWGYSTKYPDSRPFLQDIQHLSQEVTLTTDLSDRLDMLMGGLYLREDYHATVALGLPLFGIAPGAIDIDGRNLLTSWAGYTQWRYRLTDTIRLTAGVRFTHDTLDYTQRNFFFGSPDFADLNHSWNAWTPRFAVQYAPSNDLTLYANVSRGYNSGGFGGSPIESFGSEYMWNYETGLKADWFDRRLKTTLAGFYMDYADLQIETSDPNDPFVSRVFNAPSSTIKGMELELEALLTDQFRLTASGSWLDATFDKLSVHDALFPELGEPGPGGVTIRDLSGNRLVRVPEFSFNISGEYRTPIRMPFLGADVEAVLGASYAWQDKIYFDMFNHETLSQGAYGVLDLSGAIEAADGTWRLSAFVRNLTDQYYRTFKGALALAPGSLGALVMPGWPRTYGISLEHNF